MALSFLQNGVTDNIRNNKRKAKVVLITWDALPSLFRTKLNSQQDKLIRVTKWAEDNNPDYPMEARMLFGNACVPFGIHPTDMNLVKSIPCQNVAQGKKQLNEFIDAIEDDIDVQKTLADFLMKKVRFDTATIPSHLLGDA